MITLKNVTYTYMKNGPFEKKALDDISLNIKKGEFIGLIGHTGSGKSTLIQLLNGLIKPDCGEIIIDGKCITEKKADIRKLRFDVGLVMQYPEYQLFEETVYKDIAFGPKNMGLSEKEIDNRVRYAASLVGLKPEKLEKSPFDMSGGQKRRVAIAGILSMEPKILILDEPTAGLDPAGRDEILYKIKDMHKRMGLTVILVSHSMEDVAKLSDRILVMNKGKTEMFGKPDEVFRSAERLTEIGLNVPEVTRLCDKLRKNGMPIRDGIYTIADAVHEIKAVFEKER